ncbi:YOS9 [Candida pseudojiufengensis]|uniref:YOS9 n=1 Tax=Candida pseudojiufengensis TaxID=497109 RepID=UPI002224B647|nr:YOS9 [Candida pseudojiufengensis]KAI5959261.1 YOS9 [Candida pseudojiufengensis]
MHNKVLLSLLVFASHLLAYTSQKPRNRITFEDVSIPLDVANKLVDLNDQVIEKGHFEIMQNQKQQSYLCHIPTEKAINITRPISTIPIPELKVKAMSAIQETFDDGNCTFALLNYWTLGYCFGDKVMQFHEDAKDFLSGNHRAQLPNHVYILGKFPNVVSYKKTRIKNQNRGQKVTLNSNDFTIFEGEFSYFGDNDIDSSTNTQKFIKHTLFDGELCDLTLQPRTIDIVYKCDENYKTAGIMEMQEIKTCQYQMIVNVPKLCQIEEFKKNVIHDNIVDVSCKNIDSNDKFVGNNITYDDFYQFNESTKAMGSKIDVNDYFLNSLGDGFSIGSPKIKFLSDESYKDRLIIVNAKYNDDEDIIQRFGKLFISALERKLPSPIMISENVATTLNWRDSFIIWIEIYDLFGNFMGLYRIERDGSNEKRQISIQKVNMETGKDQDDIEVDIRYLHNPNAKWNYEHFQRPESTNNE